MTDHSSGIMLIEDHSVVREAHARLLRQELPRATFVEYDSVSAAMAHTADDQRLLMIILNYEIAGNPGLSGFHAIRRHHSGVPIVLVDAPATAPQALEAMDAGAAGYISKTMRGECILQAFRLILSGERFLPSFALSGRGLRMPQPSFPERSSPGGRSPIASLSPRRRQILSMVADGAPNKVIARALSVHEVTVKSHLRVIFKTLGVNTRTQAARLAMYAGMNEGDLPVGDGFPSMPSTLTNLH